MKRITRILFLTLILFCAATGLVFGASFVTESYNVDVEVNRDNSWNITETVSMNFTAPSHGIYRYIPYEGTVYYRFDGEKTEKAYKNKIKDIDVPGFVFDVSHENGSVVIRVGDPDKNVEGPVTYTINYTVSSHDDRMPQFDQFYWNLFPGDWNTPIPKGEFTIRMPGPVSQEQIEFLSGAYGTTFSYDIDYIMAGNVISGKLNRPLEQGEGMTARILLPEGYFTGERNNDWLLGLIIVLIVLAPLLAGLLWYFFGRDPKVVRTVEFDPPEGTDPAQLGYIIDGIIDNKDMVAMIIKFANQGCLSIHEDGLGVFTLTKTAELPEDARSYEKTIFAGLFKHGDQVEAGKLKEDFHESVTKAKKQLEEHFLRAKEDRLFTQSSLGARGLSLFLMMVPLCAVLFLGMAYSYQPVSLSVVALVILVGAGLCFLLFVHIYDQRYSLPAGKKAAQRIGAGLGLGIFLGALLLYSVFFIELPLPGVGAVLASSLVCFYASVMKRRTKNSAQLLGKLLGFKEFIRTAELERIKRMVEEDPRVFYRMLPYAYVFGLSDRWVERFEGIAVPPPDWYTGNSFGSAFNTVLFINSFHSCTNALQQSFAIPVNAGSGGMGGGFSAGGGFSGGGMGGGGGGGW